MNDKNIEEKARLIAERNKRLDIIKNIHVNKANIEYIAESGSINGSLMLDIEIAMDKYRQATLTQYKEALRELVELTTYLGIDNGTYLEIIKAKQLLTDKE